MHCQIGLDLDASNKAHRSWRRSQRAASSQQPAEGGEPPPSARPCRPVLLSGGPFFPAVLAQDAPESARGHPGLRASEHAFLSLVFPPPAPSASLLLPGPSRFCHSSPSRTHTHHSPLAPHYYFTQPSRTYHLAGPFYVHTSPTFAINCLRCHTSP